MVLGLFLEPKHKPSGCAISVAVDLRFEEEIKEQLFWCIFIRFLALFHSYYSLHLWSELRAVDLPLPRAEIFTFTCKIRRNFSSLELNRD